MKRLLTILAVSLAISSCGPSSYLMLLDKRQTSPSGMDLAGKSIAVVYLESESGVDSLFNNRLSDLLALGLEEEYFSGARVVDVLHMVKEEAIRKFLAVFSKTPEPLTDYPLSVEA